MRSTNLTSKLRGKMIWLAGHVSFVIYYLPVELLAGAAKEAVE